MAEIIKSIIFFLAVVGIYEAGKDAGYHRALKELADGDIHLTVNVSKDKVKITQTSE